MKTFEATGLVADISGLLCLPGFGQSSRTRVFRQDRRVLLTTNLRPSIGDCGEVGIDAGPRLVIISERVGRVIGVADQSDALRMTMCCETLASWNSAAIESIPRPNRMER